MTWITTETTADEEPGRGPGPQVQFCFTLPAELVDCIDRECGGPAAGGRPGGRSEWVRTLIRSHFGLHNSGTRLMSRILATETPALRRALPRLTDSSLRRMVELRLEGHGLTHLARKLDVEGRRTPQGRPWSVTTVRYWLEHVLRPE